MNPELVPARHDEFDVDIDEFGFLDIEDLELAELIGAELFQVNEMLVEPAPFPEPKIPITLIEIINKRYIQPVGTGSNPARYMELYGAKEINISAIEPDPITHRGDYYYNSRHNRLYKRLRTSPKPVWKVVS